MTEQENGQEEQPVVEIGDATDVVTESAAETPPIETGEVEAPKSGRDWRGWFVASAALGAVLWGLVASVGSDWGFWPWTSGMNGVIWSAGLAGFALLAALFFGWRARKGGVAIPRVLRWLGMFVSAAYLGWLVTFLIAQLSSPAIHDVSTDLADPPQYGSLVLRPDNLDHVPGVDDAAMRGMNPQQRWAAIHQKSYGDIRSVRINLPVAEVMAKAQRLAKARGWEIVASSPDEGRLEATTESRFFGFHTDMVIRVRPAENAGGSIVDMRATARELQNDRGTSAALLRAFLADLSGTLTATQ